LCIVGVMARERVVRNLSRELVRMKGVVFVANADKEEVAALMKLVGKVERELAAEREMRIEQMVSAKDMGVEPTQDGFEVQRYGTDAAVHGDAVKSRYEHPI